MGGVDSIKNAWGPNKQQKWSVVTEFRVCRICSKSVDCIFFAQPCSAATCHRSIGARPFPYVVIRNRALIAMLCVIRGDKVMVDCEFYGR